MPPAEDGGDGGREASLLRRRHRFYVQLLVIALLILGTFTLPLTLKLVIALGNTLLALLLLLELGRVAVSPLQNRFTNSGYRFVGGAAILTHYLWLYAPLSEPGSGIAMLVLWTLFLGWSTIRLLELLRQEPVVNLKVLMGAVGGYLMVGLAAGLFLSVLETLHPGSFSGVHPQGAPLPPNPDGGGLASQQEWVDRFVQLTYFAFVTLTTTGYGDVLAVSRAAQVSCLLIGIIGTTYLAVVLGLLIGRYSQEARGEG